MSSNLETPDYTDNLQLSQDSVASFVSTDSVCSGLSLSQDYPTSDFSVPGDGSKPKKKSGTKKSKKKKTKSSKLSDQDADNEDANNKPKRVKSKSSKNRENNSEKKSRKLTNRPEPEGGNVPVNINMDEYDKVIYGNEPIFSDIEIGNDDETDPVRPNRPQRSSRPGVIAIPCMLGLPSSTMIKFAIIQSELQNILRVSLKRVGFQFRKIKYMHELAWFFLVCNSSSLVVFRIYNLQTD